MEQAQTLPGGQPLRPAVGQAIAAMHARYFDPITLTDLAAEVFVSPFHFSRVFARATGVTPGRYLTAIRLFEAKRLLLTTSLTVSDIVCSVGYSSVGTFTTRFTRAVGLTPTQYRDPQVGRLLLALSPQFRSMPPFSLLREAPLSPPGPGTVSGQLVMPDGAEPANVVVGVFAERVPQCAPVAYAFKSGTRSGGFEVHGVPDGDWTVLAFAEHGGGAAFTAGAAPRQVRMRGGTVSNVRIGMHLPWPTDPPIAVTLAPSPVSAVRPLPALRAVA